MVEARIRQRVKSSMQSGRANEGAWILEYGRDFSAPEQVMPIQYLASFQRF